MTIEEIQTFVMATIKRNQQGLTESLQLLLPQHDNTEELEFQMANLTLEPSHFTKATTHTILPQTKQQRETTSLDKAINDKYLTQPTTRSSFLYHLYSVQKDTTPTTLQEQNHAKTQTIKQYTTTQNQFF